MQRVRSALIAIALIAIALIALAVLAAGCASASTASTAPSSTTLADPDGAVATAAAALEDAATSAVEDNPPAAGPDSEPDAEVASEPDPARSEPAATEAAPTVAADPGQDDATSTSEEPDDGFADSELPPAPIGFEALTPEPGGRQPVSIVIEDIDVVDATIIPVGVNPDQTFEVPPADQVGWYRFGPTPGEEGSAVLAAHIAFDGVDGVFRHLADVEVGAVVVVGYDDGTAQRYRIDSVTDYFKEELPPELFARDGTPQLALITCGGTFNPQLRSYESNTVAVATPI